LPAFGTVEHDSTYSARTKDGRSGGCFWAFSIDGISPLLMRWSGTGQAPVKKLNDVEVSLQTKDNGGTNRSESFTLTYRKMEPIFYRTESGYVQPPLIHAPATRRIRHGTSTAAHRNPLYRRCGWPGDLRLRRLWPHAAGLRSQPTAVNLSIYDLFHSVPTNCAARDLGNKFVNRVRIELRGKRIPQSNLPAELVCQHPLQFGKLLL
jgi:hypothetical protein